MARREEKDRKSGKLTGVCEGEVSGNGRKKINEVEEWEMDVLHTGKRIGKEKRYMRDK